MKVLIFLEHSKLSPVGGPLGVGYNIAQELKARNISGIEFLKSTSQKRKRYIINSRLVSWVISFLKVQYFPGLFEKMDFNKYDIVHFHSTKDLYAQRKNLEKFKGIVCLTSHSPIPLSQEMYADIVTKKPWLRSTWLQKKLEKMDIYSFCMSDYIIFPCEESEEPYFNNWPAYRKIREGKKNSYRYALTGIVPVKAKTSRADIRRNLNISESDFIVSYVGRHNEVKGYDKLKQIGDILLNEFFDMKFVVCGKEFPLTRLDNSRWIEVGWTDNAHSYINASDVFILPNKETYFDLVMLEVMSLGKIVIASKTGGNKYYQRMGAEGVFLYETIEDAVELIKKVKAMTKKEREYFEKSNKEFFNKHLTVTKFVDDYLRVLKEMGDKLEKI